MRFKRSAVVAVVLALLSPLGFVGDSWAASSGSLAATFGTTVQWGSGRQGLFVVANVGATTVDSWRVEFAVSGDTTVSSFWDATVSREGGRYVAVNRTYNGVLRPGASTSFGVVISGPGVPESCTVNGGPCLVSAGPAESSARMVGYFPESGVYGEDFHVKDVHTSGTAAKVTHLVYAFGKVVDGRCAVGDPWAAYDRPYPADESVDGVADRWNDGLLHGTFGQLRRLKRMHPHLRVLYSFGGSAWSGGFTKAAAAPAVFADSCRQLVEDPRWADVFDGIDIDWEVPNACAATCDASGPAAFGALMAAVRARFGTDSVVTAAIPGDGRVGGLLDSSDYGAAAVSVDWYMVMTYDLYGTWAAKGPTAPHAPLSAYTGLPNARLTGQAAMQKLRDKGVPAAKLLLGVPFYGRGWAGVSQSAPGGAATGPAPGTYSAGVDDYRALKTRCPVTGTAGGSAYAFCGGQWWGFDTPATVIGKAAWVRQNGLGGMFFWDLTGDTATGELVTAMRAGLG